MRCVDPGDSFVSWREAVRPLLAAGIHPGEILWGKEQGLFSESSLLREEAPLPPVRVPAEFMKFAETVACHAAPHRWALLYKILWRVVRNGERHLLEIVSDPDVSEAKTLEKNVRREIHKMHAFVRFRQIGFHDENGRERYVAWFEPDHYIVAAGAPFFRKRFANMDWSILTPKGCAHWDGSELFFSPGIPHDPSEASDDVESIWKTYYGSIFNPARLKVKMMQSEMPRRYWKNLPEAELIEELIKDSGSRLKTMYHEAPRAARAAPKNLYLNKLKDMSREVGCQYPPDPSLSLAELEKLSAACKACPLWQNATGTVFGEGPTNARMMIVGEQPGDREDVAGRPFVGPAGKVFDQAMKEAGLDRGQAYVTNAVKHFKWVPKGKVRLHQKPDSAEIDACRPWVLSELNQIKPKLLILLGGTAAQSLLGRAVSVTQERGIVDAPHLASKVILTVHPSYLLRIPDSAKKDREYAAFVDDLRLGL